MQVKRLLFPFIFGLMGSVIYGSGPLLDLSWGKQETTVTAIEVQSLAIRREHPDHPQRLTVPKLNLDLEVKAAKVTDNSWEVFDDAVSWLKTSGTLKAGNIVLYAHNTTTLFGPIPGIALGDEIVVTSSGYSKTYLVTQAFEGSRWDTYLINDYSDRLTLYTCSGFWDAYRYFVIAEQAPQI